MLEPVAPSKLGLSETRLARVSHWLEEQITSQRLAGASVLIGRRGEVGYVGTAGMADVERATPFAEDTIVRIFSMTKPITSVAAMMLYEQGCFQLDDPVAKYLLCLRFSDGLIGFGTACLSREFSCCRSALECPGAGLPSWQ